MNIGRFAPIIGTHAFFVLAGQEFDSDTVGPDFKPSADPASNWRKLGVVEDNNISVSYEGETTHYQPAPGGYKPRARTFESVELSGQLLCQDIDEFIMALAFGAKQADSEGNFVPGSQNKPQQGWLKLQKYVAEDDSLVTVMDLWVEFKIGGGIQFSKAPTKPTVEFMLLDSPLNVGKFTNWHPAAE